MKFYNPFFEDFFAPVMRPREASVEIEKPKLPFDLHKGLMRADIQETEKEFIVDVNIPGYKKEDIKLELRDDFLIIYAETKTENEEKEEGKFIKRERYVGSCKRSFYLGDKNFKEDEIKASFNDGVLKINVPKGEEEKVEKKYISID